MNYQASNGVNIELKIYYTRDNHDPSIMNTFRLTILPSKVLSCYKSAFGYSVVPEEKAGKKKSDTEPYKGQVRSP
jgi:hypothetical protein